MADKSGGSGSGGGWRIGRHRGGFAAIRGVGATRERRSLGTKDAAEAERLVADLRRLYEARDAAHGFTVTQLIEKYVAGKSPDLTDADRLKWQTKALVAHFGRMAPEHIDEAACRDFTAWRSRQGRSLGTSHTELGVLRACMRWCVKKGLIGKAPEIWMPKKPPPRDYRLTRAEVLRLIECAGPHHIKLFIRLAASTAGRASAILGLTWDRVDMDRRLIDLRDPTIAQTPKGRAIVPINDTLFAALSEARTGALTRYVIEWGGSRVMSIKKGFTAAALRAGLPGCTPHVLRHTAACLMVEAGEPIGKVAQYLGHTDSRITERVYAKYAPDYLRGASKALEF